MNNVQDTEDGGQRDLVGDTADGVAVLGVMLVLASIFMLYGVWAAVGVVGILFVIVGLVLAKRNATLRD